MVRLSCLLYACFALTTVAVASPADDRFRTLYQTEWSWRQLQFPGLDDEDHASREGDDRLPSVDPATQDKRLAYWDDVLAQLDAHSRRAAVGREPGQPRDIPSADRKPRRRHPFPRLRDAVQQRFAVLVRPRLHDPAPAEGCRRCTQLHRPPRRRAALLRPADREHACGLKRGFSVPRAVLDGRDVSIANFAEVDSPEDSEFYAPLKNLPATIPAARAGRAARGRGARDPRARDPGVREAAAVLPQRLHAACAQDARGRSPARRQGVLPPADPRIHHA